MYKPNWEDYRDWQLNEYWREVVKAEESAKMYGMPFTRFAKWTKAEFDAKKNQSDKEWIAEYELMEYEKFQPWLEHKKWLSIQVEEAKEERKKEFFKKIRRKLLEVFKK